MKCTTAEEMRELDRRTIEDLGIPGMVLMEVAGRGVVEVTLEILEPGQRFVVVAGPGNNGGDGYVAARHLHNLGFAGRVLLLGDPGKLRGDAAANRKLLLTLGGVEVVDDPATSPERQLEGDLIIDAIFGTGLTREVEGRRGDYIEAINRSGLPVVSVDVPSGLDSDRGIALGRAVQADKTASFGYLKRSMVTSLGAGLSGEIHVVDIGIPPAYADEIGVRCELLEDELVASWLPPVSSSDHKGRRGHVLILAGSSARAGAAWLAARGALRAGTGLATIVTSPGARNRMGAALPEVMVECFARGKEDLAPTDLPPIIDIMAGKSALLIGPGLAHGRETAGALHGLLVALTAPAVLDAEALNLLAHDPGFLGKASRPLVLTPHPGEMARLLGCDVPTVQADRFQSAQRCAEATGQVVVLKGARTVIAHPNGRLAVVPIECAALGTAGSGDVLGGIIAALLGRGTDPFQAAAAGAHIHGLAGELAAEREGGCAALASDIADAAGVVLDALQTPGD